MAIRVSHNVNPEILGRSARRTGQVARQERDVDRRRADAKFEASLRAQIESGEAGRTLTRETRDIAVEERRRTGETQQDFLNRQQTFREETGRAGIKQRDRTQDLQERQFEEAPGRHLQESIEQRELLMANDVWAFSEQQKREQQKINDGITWVQEQNWTSDEKQIAIQELMKRHKNILPQFGPDTSPSAQKTFNSNVVKGPDGKEYYIDSGGKATWLGKEEATILANVNNAKLAATQKSEQAKVKAAADLQTEKSKIVTELMKQTTNTFGEDGTVSGEKPAFTIQEAIAAANEIVGSPVQQQERQLTSADQSVIQIATQTLGPVEAAKVERILRVGTPEQIQAAIEFVQASTAKRR